MQLLVSIYLVDTKGVNSLGADTCRELAHFEDRETGGGKKLNVSSGGRL